MSYFKAKCTKFNFGWGFAPDPAGGAHSGLPDLREKKEKGERGRKEKSKKGKKEKREREGKG